LRVGEWMTRMKSFQKGILKRVGSIFVLEKNDT